MDQAAPKTKKKKKKTKSQYPMIGWREWVSFPELGIKRVKCKIDTGARTSAIHAYDISEKKIGRVTYIDFRVHPLQRNNRYSVKCRAPLVEYRKIRDSGGRVTERPVISTIMKISDFQWEIELTLANRDEMGFRMLLGRKALARKVTIDPAKSFLMGTGK